MIGLWLQAWADWLDAVLATGLGSPSEQTRGRIQQWCQQAELLGFSAQSDCAKRLLRSELPLAQRHQAFLDSLLEHDMLARLDAAQHLLASGETEENPAIDDEAK